MMTRIILREGLAAREGITEDGKEAVSGGMMAGILLRHAPSLKP